MLRSVIRRAQDERGFTLIELLVVILIMGMLAALVILSFINQRGKANDAQAKFDARTAQTAAETKFTDDDTYANVSLASLRTIEPSLNGSTLTAVTPNGITGFTVTATSTSNPPVTFSITRGAGAAITRGCAPQSTGGCPSGGSW